jgi:uncharacterized protein
MTPIWLAFLTGLTTGGLSCLAVQGGLLASAIASPEDEEVGLSRFKRKLGAVSIFIMTKLLGYTILGFLLGLAGSALTLTPTLLGYVQITAGLFMLATALRMIDAHPIFRFFVIQPPRWAFRFLKNTSRSESLFAPALLGFFTILMPCGVTQATMAVAVASGNPWKGAAIMFAFILGTSPIFFALGATVVELLQKKVFAYVAALAVFIFAVLSINGGVGLTGSPYTLQNFYLAATTSIGEGGSGVVAQVAADGKQQVTIDVTSGGYKAHSNILKLGVPTKITLVSNNVQSCARSFLIPSLGISKIVPQDGTTEIEITPKKLGSLAFTCGMGMYTGNFTVVN